MFTHSFCHQMKIEGESSSNRIPQGIVVGESGSEPGGLRRTSVIVTLRELNDKGNVSGVKDLIVEEGSLRGL